VTKRAESAARQLDRTLAALADPTRRGVVELLRERPRRAGELAAAFRASAPAMSRHLRVLRSRGLVEEERLEDDARVRMYRLRREPFDALQLWLRELESLWSDQLDAFGAHVARRQAARSRKRRREGQAP
jgi:DNA-binding transcriptional ArsR family regulator